MNRRRSHLPNVNEVLDTLEKLYGPQNAVGHTDLYEMILYLNSGYRATDASCSKGFDALKRDVGLKPEEILAASKAKLAKLLRLGGIVPEQRAARLREIARKVKSEFGGDLKAELKKRVQEKYQASKGIHSRRKILREFPVIGEPSADKILLFSKLAPVAAVPSAFLRAPIRLRFCREWKNY